MAMVVVPGSVHRLSVQPGWVDFVGNGGTQQVVPGGPACSRRRHRRRRLPLAVQAQVVVAMLRPVVVALKLLHLGQAAFGRAPRLHPGNRDLLHFAGTLVRPRPARKVKLYSIWK